MALIVNGEHIADAHIEDVATQLRQAAGPGVPEWEAKGISLDAFARNMVVAQVLVRQEAGKRGPPVPAQHVDRELNRLRQQHGGDQGFREYVNNSNLTMQEIRDQIELGIKLDGLLDEVCADVGEPEEREAKEYYDANVAAFEAPEQIRVAHIVKHVEGTILDLQAAHTDLKDVVARLKEGASFEALASEHSECPENGGDLGYFGRGAMVPEFEEVVFTLEKGEVSRVFQTPFGLHIAKLQDRIPAQPRSFDEVRDEVKQVLRNERENAVIDAFTDGLRKKASIEETLEEG